MRYLTTAALLFPLSLHAQHSKHAATVDDSTSYNLVMLDNDDTVLKNLWIDDEHSFRMHIDNRNATVSFSILKDKKWMAAGKFKPTIGDVVEVWSEDLNGDGVNEVITATGRNMNGNQWFDVYIFISGKDVLGYAGSFNTDHKVDAARKTIEVSYEGSWYMDVYKTLYKWHGYKLMPERTIMKARKGEERKSDSVYLEYYESMPAGSGNMKLKTKKLYATDDKKMEVMWDHFFDQGKTK